MGNVPRWLLWATGLALAAVLAAHGGGFHQWGQRASNATDKPLSGLVNSDDVRSADRILAALYATLSGSAGQHRDWNRLRSLFVPGGRIVAVGHGPDSAVQTQSFSVDEYIARAAPVLEKEGLWEGEIARHIEAYEHMAQVLSIYEARHNSGEKPFQRGINSIQLMNDGNRWWVVSVFWEPETPGHPLPKKYLR